MTHLHIRAGAVGNNRRLMAEHVDVLVEERIDFQDSLFLLQRADRMFAVVRWGWDTDPMAATAQEALERVRWFPRDTIAGALTTANVRPLVDPENLLSFYGACAVSLGLVEDERHREIQSKYDRVKRERDEAIKHLRRFVPKAKHVRQANGFINAGRAR